MPLPLVSYCGGDLYLYRYNLQDHNQISKDSDRVAVVWSGLIVFERKVYTICKLLKISVCFAVLEDYVENAHINLRIQAFKIFISVYPLLKFRSYVLTEIKSPQRNHPQCPRGLRRGSTAARLLGLWVRIPPGAWMFVLCLLYKDGSMERKSDMKTKTI
jgi:hypothetical protein